jgi:putative transposase
VSVALSSGELLCVPGLRTGESKRLRRLQQRLARARRGSRRRARTKLAIARLRARETDRRRDWMEKTTTDVARRFDTIRVEDLKVRTMTRSAHGTRASPGVNVAQKRCLNREIHRQGWGLLVARLKRKAAGGSNSSLLRTRRNDASAAGMRAGKPQEPSGFPVRRLRRGPVQC